MVAAATEAASPAVIILVVASDEGHSGLQAEGEASESPSSDELLAALGLDPVGEFPDPPVDTAAQVLPLGELGWEWFEQLCYRLARLEGRPERAQLFGTRGQDQSGIDIFSRLSAGSYATYQCKRYEKFTDGDVRKAVDAFIDEEWASRSERFILCTTYSAVRTERARAIEEQTERLRDHQPNSIAFEVWDREELSAKLKAHPDLVRDFFGPEWLRRFLPGVGELDLATRLEAVIREEVAQAPARPYQRTRVVSLDWAPERLRAEFERLREEAIEQFEAVVENLGLPPDRRLLAAAIEAVPPWLQDADGRLWELLARSAEASGEWAAASSAWEKGGALQDTDGHVRALMSAAAAASVARDDGRHDQLVERAGELDSAHPRVLMERVSQNVSGPEQLPGLLELQPVHPDDVALVAGRLTVAHLLVPDLAAAQEQYRRVEEHAPGSAMTAGLRVSLRVQEGRLAIISGRPMDAPALRQAQMDALSTRDRLLSEGRYEESARLLMLAADSLSLLNERADAAKLLEQAEAAELSAPSGSIVLADAAASRALDFRLGLKLLDDDDESPAARRIRAECLEAVGTGPERAEALKTLEALVVDAADEAREAAFLRLAATLGQRRTAWSDLAEQYLLDHGFVGPAVIARCFYFSRWEGKYETADELLLEHIDQPWAKAARLRLAVSRGKQSRIRTAADTVMTSGMLQQFRLEAGQAYAMVGDFERAKEVLLGLARDLSAPLPVRRTAYRLLMRVVGVHLGEWLSAEDLFRDWVDLSPGDPATFNWGPMVASRAAAVRREAL